MANGNENKAIVKATLTDITKVLGPSKFRIEFETPDGVKRGRTGSITECVEYARTKAWEHNALLRISEEV